MTKPFVCFVCFLKVPILCQSPASFCLMLVTSVADWQHLLYSGYVFEIILNQVGRVSSKFVHASHVHVKYLFQQNPDCPNLKFFCNAQFCSLGKNFRRNLHLQNTQFLEPISIPCNWFENCSSSKSQEKFTPQLMEGTGYEARQTSNEQTKMPRFMLEGPRPCTIFCFAFIHHA